VRPPVAQQLQSAELLQQQGEGVAAERQQLAERKLQPQASTRHRL